MPPKTRHQKNHLGIRRTHGAHQPMPAGLRRNLSGYIELNGVKQFLADSVRGNISFHGTTILRREVIAALDHDAMFRGLVSRKWRQEDPHHHEWIPCTYLCHIASRAIAAQDFRFVRLADEMRSLTQSVIFKPRLGDTNQVHTHDAARNKANFIVLQAHPGGLRFRAAPAHLYAMQLHRFTDGNFLTEYSQGFHNDIIAALRTPGPPAALLAAIYAVFQNHCWNGGFPVNGHTAANLWQYYQRGDGTVIDPTTFAAFCASINVEYTAIDTNFTTTWQNTATSGYTAPPMFWM